MHSFDESRGAFVFMRNTSVGLPALLWFLSWSNLCSLVFRSGVRVK